jgi:hypothetical protein
MPLSQQAALYAIDLASKGHKETPLTRLKPLYSLSNGEIDKFFILLGTVVAIAALYIGTFALLGQRYGSFIGSLLWLCLSSCVVKACLTDIAQISMPGKSRSWIHEDRARVGAPIHFTFEHKFGRRVQIESIGVFLVFREAMVIHPPEHTGGTFFTKDRLIQEFLGQGRTYERGETLMETCTFDIPLRPMSPRHFHPSPEVKSIETSWIIKVRLDLEGDFEHDFQATQWREFVLKVDPKPLPGVSMDSDFDPTARFDIFMLDQQPDSFDRLMQAWNILMPHIRENRLSYPFGKNMLLLEWKTRAEAEALKAQLEAAGAIIEIRPSV